MIRLILVGFLVIGNSVIAAEEKVRFPKTLLCSYDSDDRTVDRLVTRLPMAADLLALPEDEKAMELYSSSSGKGKSPRPDEVAWDWRGEYFQVTLSRDTYRYSLWTCDSEDRWYQFSTRELAIPENSTAKFRKVTGVVRIESRETGLDFPLTCIAEY